MPNVPHDKRSISRFRGQEEVGEGTHLPLRVVCVGQGALRPYRDYTTRAWDVKCYSCFYFYHRVVGKFQVFPISMGNKHSYDRSQHEVSVRANPRCSCYRYLVCNNLSLRRVRKTVVAKTFLTQSTVSHQVP